MLPKSIPKVNKYTLPPFLRKNGGLFSGTPFKIEFITSYLDDLHYARGRTTGSAYRSIILLRTSEATLKFQLSGEKSLFFGVFCQILDFAKISPLYSAEGELKLGYFGFPSHGNLPESITTPPTAFPCPERYFVVE